MKFAEKVSILRNRKNMSQADLGQALNLSKQAVQKWESGAGMPDISVMIPLSKILDCSVDILLDDEQDLPPEKPKVREPAIVKRKITYKQLQLRKRRNGIIFLIIGLIIMVPGIIGRMISDNWSIRLAFTLAMLIGLTISLCSFLVFTIFLKRYEFEGHEIIAYAGSSKHYLIVDEFLEDYLNAELIFKDRQLRTTLDGHEVVMNITWTNNVTVKIDGKPIFPAN